MRRYREAFVLGKQYRGQTDLEKWRAAQGMFPFETRSDIRRSEFWGFLKGARYLKSL